MAFHDYGIPLIGIGIFIAMPYALYALLSAVGRYSRPYEPQPVHLKVRRLLSGMIKWGIVLGIFAYCMSQVPSHLWEKIKEPVTKQEVLLVAGFFGIVGWAVASTLHDMLSEIASRLERLELRLLALQPPQHF